LWRLLLASLCNRPSQETWPVALSSFANTPVRRCAYPARNAGELANIKNGI
jgi:hypothetical protein